MTTRANESPDPEQLYRQGLEAFRRGDQIESQRLNEEALEIARRGADEINQIRALIGLSRIAFREGDHDEVVRLAAECEPLWERLEDKTVATSPFHMLAESHRLHGRFEEARHLYLRNIVEAREAEDNELVEIETLNLALLEVMDGNHAEALRLGLEIAASREEVDDPYLGLVLGAARIGLGNVREGVADIAACSLLLEKDGIVLDPADQPIFDDAIRDARVALGEEQFMEVWG